jgi:hypothetical protein
MIPIELFRSFRDPIQLVSLLIITMSIVYGIMWARRDTCRWLWMLPVLFWLIHGFVFYAYVQLSVVYPTMPRGFFTTWAAILRLQGYLTVFAIIFTLNKLNGKVDHDCR